MYNLRLTGNNCLIRRKIYCKASGSIHILFRTEQKSIISSVLISTAQFFATWKENFIFIQTKRHIQYTWIWLIKSPLTHDTLNTENPEPKTNFNYTFINWRNLIYIFHEVSSQSLQKKSSRIYGSPQECMIDWSKLVLNTSTSVQHFMRYFINIVFQHIY